MPKAIADQYGIRPGTEIEWLPAGESIRVVPPLRFSAEADRKRRLEIFDAATERQRARSAARSRHTSGADRGWRREDLYDRDRTR